MSPTEAAAASDSPAETAERRALPYARIAPTAAFVLSRTAAREAVARRVEGDRRFAAIVPSPYLSIGAKRSLGASANA
jgi:hypothetical protein